ncbi:MAG: hypothetical protein RL087_64, partial [Pseudomonadota bacterium]
MNRRTPIPPATPPLLEVRNLAKRFPVRAGLLGRGGEQVHAVD